MQQLSKSFKCCLEDNSSGNAVVYPPNWAALKSPAMGINMAVASLTVLVVKNSTFIISPNISILGRFFVP